MQPKKTKRLCIFGADAIAKMAWYYFSRDTEYEVSAFVVDREYLKTESFLGLPLISADEIATKMPAAQCDAFVAVGYRQMNGVRAAKYQMLKDLGYHLPNYISPRCTFLTEEPIGDNNLIMEDTTIQPFVRIGSNNVFWSGVHVAHETSIGNHCFFASHCVVAGFVQIEDFCFLGANSTLSDGVVVHSRALIGAGAAVMSDAAAGGVYIPSPTKRLQRTSREIEPFLHFRRKRVPPS